MSRFFVEVGISGSKDTVQFWPNCWWSSANLYKKSVTCLWSGCHAFFVEVWSGSFPNLLEIWRNCTEISIFRSKCSQAPSRECPKTSVHATWTRTTQTGIIRPKVYNKNRVFLPPFPGAWIFKDLKSPCRQGGSTTPLLENIAILPSNLTFPIHMVS